MEYLFVYGTLMRGEDREGLLMHLNPVPATSRGHLWHAAAGYPAFQADETGDPIHGELLPFRDPQLLRLLDLIEGVAEGLYSRIEVTVDGPDGVVTAWTYAMDRHQRRRAQCKPVQATDWRTYRR